MYMYSKNLQCGNFWVLYSLPIFVFFKVLQTWCFDIAKLRYLNWSLRLDPNANVIYMYPLVVWCVHQDCANGTIDQGLGLLSQFSPFRYFPHFPLLSKQTLATEYHVYISQVSPQLGCGDICQIWMWFMESNRYFCKIENFAYGEISERSFSNPHPSTMTTSNGNIFCVTCPLCGECTGHRWILRTKASDAEFWCFLWSPPE